MFDSEAYSFRFITLGKYLKMIRVALIVLDVVGFTKKERHKQKKKGQNRKQSKDTTF